MKYEFTINWKRWKKGDVIDEYEFARLPFEIKPKVTPKVEVLNTVVPKPKVESNSRVPEVLEWDLPKVEKKWKKPDEILGELDDTI